MKANQILTCDLSTSRERTESGFLKVSILAGKVGVQRYSCSELGVPDKHGTGYVNVARLPEHVFAQASLDSLEFVDITDNHPRERLVTADNYKQRSAGTVITKGEKHSDGVHIKVNAVVKDAATVSAIDAGKEEVSLGYIHELVEKTGSFDGQDYDYYQKDIHYNHLAIVHRGRAGATCRVLDSLTLIEDSIMTPEEIAAMKAENAQLKADNQKLILDHESAELERTIDKAIVIDSKVETRGKTSEQIKRAVLGSVITADHSIDVVNFAFEQAYNTAKGKPTERHTHKPINFQTNDSESDEEHEKERKKIAQDCEDARAEYLKSFD